MQAGNPQRGFEGALDAGAYSAAWRYCCRLSATREDAEDLLQDALAQGYLRFAQLRDPARFKGWLLSIVRSKHLMRLRTAGRRPRTVQEYQGITAVSRGKPDQLAAEVLEELARLPAHHRELLVLFYLEGLSLAETGQVLGVNPRVLRQRLLRARHALRARVQLARAYAHAPASPKRIAQG